MNNKASGEELLKYINSLPVSSNGLYDYPGQNVVVPTGGNITMQGINYPVLGISMETGEQQLMMPNGSYDFPDTNNVLEIPQYQNGGRKTSMDYPYDVNEIRGFLQTMISAPWYKERIKKNGYDPNWVDPSLERAKYYNPTDQQLEQSSNNVVAQRLKNLQNVKFDVEHTPVGSRFYVPTNTVTLDPGQTNAYKAHPRSVVTHEFSHATRNKGYENSKLSRYEQGLIGMRASKQNTESHVRDPEEAKSDMDAIRYNLYKAGKFDPKTGKYQTPNGKFQPSLFEFIKNDYTTKRMRDTYNDYSLSYLLNTIAQNDTNDDEDLFYAQDGGKIITRDIPPVVMTNLGNYSIGLDEINGAIQLPDYENPGQSTFKNYDEYVLNQYRDWGNLEDFSIVDAEGEEYVPSQEFGTDDQGNYVDMRLDKFFPNGDNFYNRTYIPNNIQEQMDLQNTYAKNKVGIDARNIIPETPYTEADFEKRRQFMLDYINGDDYRNLLSNYYPNARQEQIDRATRVASVPLNIYTNKEIQEQANRPDMHVKGYVAQYGDSYNMRNINPEAIAKEPFFRGNTSVKTLSKEQVKDLANRGLVANNNMDFPEEVWGYMTDGVDNKSVNVANMQSGEVGVHELGHFARRAVSPNQFQDILKHTRNTQAPENLIELPNGRFAPVDYVRTPTEITSRLDAMRYLLKENGIKDTTKSLQLTEKELEKALKNPKINADGNVRQLIEATNNSQDLLWLLNNIVDNSSKPGQDLRQYMG